MEDQGLYLKEFETANCGAGFICNLHGKTSHSIIHNALDILVRLEHRGAVSADGKTGDGAGILIDIPHDYFARVCEFPLPNFREYAVGMLFMPTKTTQQRFCKEIFETELNEQNISILGWRKVPVNNAVLGSIAAETEPAIVQVFLKNSLISVILNFKKIVCCSQSDGTKNCSFQTLSSELLLCFFAVYSYHYLQRTPHS